MLGFNLFRNAATTRSGVELIHRIRKDQFNLARLRLKDTTTPAAWTAVLSAPRCNDEYVAFRSRPQFAPQPGSI